MNYAQSWRRWRHRSDRAVRIPAPASLSGRRETLTQGSGIRNRHPYLAGWRGGCCLVIALAIGPLHRVRAASPETVPMPAPAETASAPAPVVNYPLSDSSPGPSNDVRGFAAGESVWIVEDGVQVQYFYRPDGWVYWDLDRRAHYASAVVLRQIEARRLSGGFGIPRYVHYSPAHYGHAVIHASPVFHSVTSLPNAAPRPIFRASPGHSTASASAHMPLH